MTPCYLTVMTPSRKQWVKIKAGSWGTEDGWNAWRIGRGWNIRSPRGEYWRAPTLREAQVLVERLPATS